MRSLILDALSAGQREAGLLGAANEACKLDVCRLLKRRHGALARGIRVVAAPPPPNPPPQTSRLRHPGGATPRGGAEPAAKEPVPVLRDAAARMAKLAGLHSEEARLRADHWGEVVRSAANAANAAAAAAAAPPKQQALSGLRAWVREASAASSGGQGGDSAGDADPSPASRRSQLPGGLPPPEFKGSINL